jgi:aldehyde:ferredoxin oxidoreductase
MYGYAGKILYVNLTEKITKTHVLRENEAKKYIGGLGYALKLLYDHTEPKKDPFDPKNVLVFATGPISGMMAPTGSGYIVASKSPLTGGLGVSVEQGFFASELKRAGYDAIIIEGKAKTPVFLWINDDFVQLMDARDVWGLSPARTEEEIRKQLGDYSIRVAAIGLAGERLARFACIISDQTRVAGRGGLGAVMGAKNLKAIAVRGTSELKVANPNALLEFCKEFFIRARGSTAVKHYTTDGKLAVSVKDRYWVTLFGTTAKYRDLGSVEDLSTCNGAGCLPTRNFSAASFEDAEKISGEHLNRYFVAKVQACSSCPIGCEHIAIVSEGPYQGAVARIEYQTVWAFGPNCGVNRPDAIIRAIELCNFYGLDAVSTGGAIAFAMDCYENGIITYDDTNGLDLKFGNYEAMLKLIDLIAHREELGDILAEGVKRAAERIGKGSETVANHIKGLEMSGYDVRGLKTAALGYAVSFKGADHNTHWAHVFDLNKKENRFIFQKGSGKIVKDMEDLFAVMDSLVVCKFTVSVYDGYEDLARLYNIVTGFNLKAADLKIVGERINNLARLFNIREGFTRKDDGLPPKIISTPIPSGPSKGVLITKEELDFMLDEYYEVRGWTHDGIPTPEKLKELELRDLGD